MSTSLPPAIVFSDWDGTITLQDSNDYLTDNIGMGYDNRMIINDKILEEKQSFRDGFKEMLASINKPFDECIEILLQNVQLDPGFKDFYQYCQSKGIPIIVISSGMKPIIYALLEKLIGQEAIKTIDIISNDVRVDGDNWEIVFKDPESGFGHDKAKSIKEYLTSHGYAGDADTPRPTLFYNGDGVSDLSAAKETDLLFAKHGKDLIKYCVREKIPYTEFNDFQDILNKVSKIIDGEKKISDFVEN
ncbi:conserved hypothetical protein [Candida dubliniensis CD36]|uniref:Phosphoserine phosphatase n=1 Tax=Candida dubliniensis (strain CD36 / ATCC MYA-646 / CBS 7987 / NCPF 3949 / NRRL Y-17841) TaxID=573826 RepID=B9WC01_CANDC|nr:conserved hypothetical protein [Candida dubliniensis CD36]CAX43923.1 conserved hypothetical protein [Candida dubliniensis CD36]